MIGNPYDGSEFLFGRVARFGDILPAEQREAQFAWRESLLVEEEFMFKERSWERPEFGEVEGVQAGVQKWLLLYRPEGIGGWITHFLFYFCVLSALVLKVAGVLAAAGALHDSSRWLALICFTSASLFVWPTFYLREVSQRLASGGKRGRKPDSQ